MLSRSPAVIALLSSASPEVHRDVAGALWSLASPVANQIQIASANGIAPLVQLLRTASGGSQHAAQDTAAGALRVLAELDDNCSKIADEGGVSALVNLFCSGSNAAATQAAGALGALAAGREKNRRSIAGEVVALLAGDKWTPTMTSSAKAEAQEHGTRLLRDLATDPANRDALSSAGAVPQLVQQLRDGTEAARGMAAGALAQIALKSTEHRVQVTQELVVLLASREAAVRLRAADAMRDLAAAGSSDSREMAVIALAGGVGPLVAFLKDGYVEAQEYALWSLSLATEVEQKIKIAEAGCVEPLISVVNKGQLSSDAQEHAAGVLSALAALTTPVSLPMPPGSIADGCAGGGAGAATADGLVLGAALIVRANGIAPLVSLLHAGSNGAKRHAASALAMLARMDAPTQIAIFAAGAVSALIEWLPPVDEAELGGGDASKPAQQHQHPAEDEQARRARHASQDVPTPPEEEPTKKRRAIAVDCGPPELAARALCDLSRHNPSMQTAISEAGAISPRALPGPCQLEPPLLDP